MNRIRSRIPQSGRSGLYACNSTIRSAGEIVSSISRKYCGCNSSGNHSISAYYSMFVMRPIIESSEIDSCVCKFSSVASGSAAADTFRMSAAASWRCKLKFVHGEASGPHSAHANAMSQSRQRLESLRHEQR